MITEDEILAQNYPAAGVMTDIYTVPDLSVTRVKAVFVCNHEAVDTTFSVAISKLGSAVLNQHYIYRDTPLYANDTFLLDHQVLQALGFREHSVFSMSSANGQVSFTIVGEEKTVGDEE